MNGSETVECTLPGPISSVSLQSRRTDRVNVFVDGTFCFACRAEVAARLHLRIGTLLTPELRDRAIEDDSFYSAYAAAIELLAHRGRSEHEVRDRLKRRHFDEVVIERVVSRLRENHYLDDAAFARSWIENRAAHRPRGDRALRQELRSKGIRSQVVDAALEDANLDQSSMALEAARKRAASLSGLEPEVQRRRLIGFLQRRGFSWDAIRPAVDAALGPENDRDIEEIGDQ